MSNEYYKSSKISQSKVKYFINCKEKYYSKYVLNDVQDDDTYSMGFGRYYHTLVFQPELMDEKYIIDEGLKVEGMMGVFIEEYAKTQDKEASYTKAGFKWSIEKVWENFEKAENQRYYKFLLDTTGKEIISKEDWTKGRTMLMRLFQNNDVSKLINPKGNVEIFNELVIEWTTNYCKLELQSMLDRVIINNDTNTIDIIDLKTTRDYSLKGFIYTIKKYRYDIQAIFYKNAIEWKVENDEKWYKYKDYDISFTFIPQYTEYPYHCLKPCRIEDSDLQVSYLEYRQALIDMETCITLNTWESDSEKADIDGVVTIKLNI